MFFSNGEPRDVGNKLLINLFGLTISADGIYAIVAVVIIIVLVLSAAAAAMIRHCDRWHHRSLSCCRWWTRG